ncbi:MAG TPA: flavin reductase family protein [Methylomusa anaerophila]|uniref:Flavoredoxin n=1 Tax=Methylomusa anaerophila TaxID=1930071 RepID=A0A348AH03_9FIRM|nr:flavin reductase family protein [Methylomusa anaerophila]BBB90351.1 flavoredoxin [Methylomusa anaerophila]HML89303.1 flavin reductase family protein [Methylomusa anaerophila]
MSEQLSYGTYAAKAAELMAKNAFMTTSYGGKHNTMTIGWGTVGIVWQKPIFIALVRQSRFTKGLVEKSGEYTVTFPLADMKEALAFCGANSGRDMDKLAAAKLSVKPGQAQGTPIIDIPGLQLECKVVYRQTMDPAALNADYNAKMYPGGDYHTLYYGEIVAAYITK